LAGAAAVNGDSSGSTTHHSPLTTHHAPRTTHSSCVVEVQPALLGELLNILIDNACKYSRAGTPITIRLQCEEQAVCVQVEDQGSGIAESDLPHLFTPFFRSAQTRRLGVEGFGLGLSIARRLAGALGGAVTVTSRIGHGSCFTLRLAAAAAPQRAKLAIDI
jgi:signal transduction histidine kinase